MDEDDGAFYVDPEEQEVRQIAELQQANPVYCKTTAGEQKNIALRMIDIQKPEIAFRYQSFTINDKQQSQQSELDHDHDKFRFSSPFDEYYSKQRMIYRRFNNQYLNQINELTYFSGLFVPKNVLFDCNKQQARCIVDLLEEEFEIQKQQFKLQEDQLHFDSNFQSGNLFAVFKITERQYDLVMQNDLNSYGNNQWFYFSVSKMLAGVQYTFNVVNFTKKDSLFNYGMAPVAYSQVQNKKNNSQWFKIGRDVVYKKGKILKQGSRRYYYQLTFKFTWKHLNDKLYFAYSYPYTYSKLLNRIHSILNHYQQIVAKITIGKTLSKKNIQALVITQKSKSKKDQRKAIIVMARQHPGEVQGSYVCDGVINHLLERSKEGDFIRKNYVIYVIPMVNPDGVIFGHYRTNLAGKDLNRKWDSTEKQLMCPQVTSIKLFLAQLNKTRQIRFILDLHGHSKKLNSFFYGNPCPQNPEEVRIFPYLCSKMNCAVQFMDCTFAAQQYKRKAARVYLSYMFKQIQVYTFESSFYGYFKQGKKEEFTIKQYENLGHTLVRSLYTILQNDCKESKKDSLYLKSLNELKSNKLLLSVGDQAQSGSDSRPEQGQLNQNDLLSSILSQKKITVTPSNAESTKKSEKQVHSRKGIRQPPQIREVSRPIRNLKFLQISRVNSVLPDKYQFGLQPIKRKQPAESKMSKTHSSILKINSYSQTDIHQSLFQLGDKEIIQSENLSNSVKLELRNSSSKRFSSIVKSTHRNNNIIFRIDFLNARSSSTSIKIKQSKFIFNAFSQTIITFKRKVSDKIKSSQLLPYVESPDLDRNRTNNIKYHSTKLGMKKQAEVFFNGMIKNYLLQKDIKQQQNPLKCIERPLSIKKKQIYKK